MELNIVLFFFFRFFCIENLNVCFIIFVVWYFVDKKILSFLGGSFDNKKVKLNFLLLKNIFFV